MSRECWEKTDDEMIIKKAEELKDQVLSAAVEGKLGCARAFQIAEEEGITKKEIGYILNILNIQIGSCQLGCFK